MEKNMLTTALSPTPFRPQTILGSPFMHAMKVLGPMGKLYSVNSILTGKLVIFSKTPAYSSETFEGYMIVLWKQYFRQKFLCFANI